MVIDGISRLAIAYFVLIGIMNWSRTVIHIDPEMLIKLYYFQLL